MKKLKIKTFTVLVSLLTLFLVSVLAIVNIDANNKYNDMERAVFRIGNAYLNPVTNIPSNPIAVNINSALSDIENKRSSLAYMSIISFIFLEFAALSISYLITKWLTKPVEETFASQQQFISDASHELKTPLAVILASSEMLEQNPKDTKYLENIKSETEKMNKLVINLLELSKTENTINPETFSETNLSNLVETKSLSFESLMFEQNLELNLEIEKDIKLKCDEDKIKELLSILIDNAIKHAYKKSKITISLKKQKDNIVLQVKNRGNPIPASEQEKIFERFYRVDKSRNRNSESYGLGLAIAKNIATTHNAKISVDCKNGYTTFSVTFSSK